MSDAKKCNKIGHFAAVCRSGQAPKEHEARVLNEIEIEGDVAVAESDGVNTIGDKHEEFLYATEGGSDFFTTTLSIDGRPCKGLLDTGASPTILTSDIAQPTRKSDRTLRAYNGGVVETLGMADVTIASVSQHDLFLLHCS